MLDLFYDFSFDYLPKDDMVAYTYAQVVCKRLQIKMFN